MAGQWATTEGAHATGPSRPKEKTWMQSNDAYYVQPRGQKIGARKREGTRLKTSSNLMIKNITDDSNMGVGGLKADK